MTTHTHLRRAAMAGLALGVMAAPAAHARDFFTTVMRIDLAAGEASSRIFGVEEDPVVLLAASDIQDGVFTYLDLEFALTENTETAVQKMVDQGFTSEPSGCQAGAFGPLDMEDGLRYFATLPAVTPRGGGDPEQARVTVYPGNRSTHWTNDVSCEYDDVRDNGSANLRISGYFFVIHRRLEDGTDVQLRAVTLTENEADNVRQQLTESAQGRAALR